MILRDSGQVSTSEEKMANRGGGKGEGGKEGKQVECCETAVSSTEEQESSTECSSLVPPDTISSH